MSSVDWTFGGTWPYEPRWFDTHDGRLHYVDEGPRDAPPVVLVHGNPTWGYLYRNFIPPVLDELWLGTFPRAVVTRVPDAGHFVQEDAYERVVPALLELLGRDDSRSSAHAAGPARLPGRDRDETGTWMRTEEWGR